ncbi:hypothetical protein [Streptomyces mirabilis]|uniref:hypothetical protein n=1 Tax=Streptomyces mirabilis TaxID=68239 RepID=UPI0036DB6B8F
MGEGQQQARGSTRRQLGPYIGRTEQCSTRTEYYGLRLDRQGRLPGGVKLHGASAEQERRLGVPESARRLTAARAT